MNFFEMDSKELLKVEGGFWGAVVTLFIAACGASYAVSYSLRKSENERKFYEEKNRELDKIYNPTPVPAPTPTIIPIGG